jgi:hypothetical protein
MGTRFKVAKGTVEMLFMVVRVAFVWLALSVLPVLYAQDSSGGSASSTKTFELKYADPEDLRKIFSGQSYVMETNRELKLLTAHGSAAFLKEVEDTVKRFDVPPPLPADIEITFYLLAPTGGPLPKELAALTKDSAFKLADSQLIRVRAGLGADAIGIAAPPAAPDTATFSRVQFQSATLNPDLKAEVISLTGLRIWLKGSQPKADADILANIDVPGNQAVIVAKSGTDKPVMVVVRVSSVKNK